MTSIFLQGGYFSSIALLKYEVVFDRGAIEKILTVELYGRHLEKIICRKGIQASYF